MHGADQGYGGFPPLNTRKEYSHGCGCGRCSSQFWDATIQIMGSQALGDIANGLILFHDPSLWRIKAFV